MNNIFYIAAFVAILSSVMAISRKNSIHALLYLVLSLLSIAIVFYLVGAPFVAALEVIVYAGAIMVLFIFVVMMLNISKEEEHEKVWLLPKSWIIPSLLALILLVNFILVLKHNKSDDVKLDIISPKQVGISLFTDYLLAVELAGMLLLGGIVGAYHLGKRKKKSIHRFYNQEENK